MEDGTEKWVRHICDTDAAVSTRAILNLTGDKWSLHVVMLLEDGPIRFSDLKRSVGPISQRMLTRTLRQLERNGLVDRTVYPRIPPRVEYQLTPLGQSLREAIFPLKSWAIDHHDELTTARVRYDSNQEPGDESSNGRTHSGGVSSDTLLLRSKSNGPESAA